MVIWKINALDRKLLRDLWHLRGQLLAVAAIVGCGIGIFLTMRGMYESLVYERADYYAQYRFADVFDNVKRAPESLTKRIAEIPGVAAVETGISLEVTLDVPGLKEPATGQLITIPQQGPALLNQVYIRRGRTISPNATDEVLVSEAFARANSLEPGSRLDAVINGHWQRLNVVGIAISPEFIYVLRPTSGLPDDRRFGILWMGRNAVEHAFDMAGAFNRVAVSLSSGASEADVISSLDQLLDRYGSLGAYGRVDHLSDKVISDEINQDRVYGFLVSGIFLAVAAFIINIVLTRLIATQRDQIGVLKAFGYGNKVVAWHYLKLVLVTLLIGTAMGIPVAYWMGNLLAGIYRDFFYFPRLEWSLSPVGLISATGVCFIAALGGAYSALARAANLPPAEAMLPEPPGRFRPTLIERAGFQGLLSVTTRMILRNLERRPLKALLSMFGIALAVAILVAGGYGMDALDRIIDIQFRAAQREDIMLEFANTLSSNARHAVRHLPGVVAVEPFRAAPVRLRFQHHVRRTAILGLSPEGDLRAIVGLDYARTALPSEGLLLSAKLAESLGVVPGDRLTVEILEGRRETSEVVVAGIVNDLVGISAYMTLPNLNRMLHEDATTSGAFVSVDPNLNATLYEELKRLPTVRGVSVKEAILANFKEVIARSMRVQTFMNIFFACIIAFGVVYNSVRIALSERGHELASLRVLGFTQREIAIILLGEQALITASAIPLGFVIGYGICAGVAAAINATQETFRMPLTLSTQTFAFSFVVVSIAAALSGLMIWGRLNRLDLVAVLKTRE
jgi:putative ABC transport system permease protein